jgi:NAD+ synthase (glutamine-hydrolysing)
MMKVLGVTCIEIDIKSAVTSHLADIGHGGQPDVTYENAQARERTQILFDIANMHNALALGTGDMSEAALGWCTFGGDTMSHYNINASVPKTIVRELVKHVAGNSPEELKSVLLDVCDTPISPELLADQKTEDIVGPYELHDFFMYYFAKGKFTKEEVRHYTLATFDDYTDEEIDKWLELFFKRFSRSSFKRASSLSPRIIESIAEP